MNKRWAITLSQARYGEDLPKIGPAPYIVAGSAIGGEEFRPTTRKAIGALIWIHRALPDVGIDIAKIATRDVPAFTVAPSGDLAWTLISLYIKSTRYPGEITIVRYIFARY